MTALASIVLADAQATPVNHTYIPMGPDAKGVWWWEDQSAASAAGFARISAEIKRPLPAKPGVATSGRNFRITLVLSIPTLEVLSNTTVAGIIPAPIVSYVPRAEVTFIIPERSTLQNRKDLRKEIGLLVADSAMMIPLIEQLQSIY